MLVKWIIDDNHLALQRGGEREQLTAAVLLDYLSGDKRFDDEDITDLNPRELFVAKVGIPLKAEICQLSQAASINFSLYVIHRGVRISVDIRNGAVIDHGINNNTWFYITGPIEELNDFLRLAKITQTGDLRLHQYLDLVRLCEKADFTLIENRIDMSLIDKPIAATGLVPQHVTAELYGYQKTGYAWLKYMADERCGCILGDEMGLGKTLQIISLMSDYAADKKTPMLVIAPVSLLENWKREINKFAPEMEPYIHHGIQRTGRYQELKKYDVVIISYNTAVSDLSMLRMINWPLVSVDEAQNIKNPSSERARSIKRLPRDMSIAISGTPFENHITDIWSITDFVFPEYLGTLTSFNDTVSDDVFGAQLIEPMITPIMIRRMVRDVADDLPEKVIIPQPIRMSDTECSEYEIIRQEAFAKSLNSPLDLGLLQRLRMFCTHPDIIETNQFGDPLNRSMKYERLCEILDEILMSGEKVLIFTSYKKMFDIFTRDLPRRYGILVLAINGETPVEDRQNLVDTFSGIQGSAIFILNPRAAGTGLNITAANHVIHYNLEWNPALEDQSSARAFRRGQDKTVFVHRLFYVDSVEQIVNERIERKRVISEAAIVGTSGMQENRKDITNALLLSPLH
ncbi:MAG TPA: DEAD/DEAH box helicase [Negativicutes bacterium]|nr:DEAD/DEAH box helicase [Clostridia bacterium]HWR29007.1 DEAD/DEAH box helicase [Negativicutes bacterium]